MPSTVVVGGFFGDEGKGKIISYLAQKDDPSIVVRGGAGPNAGHTIEDGAKKYKVRMLPSGFLNKKAQLMIGPGVVVNPDVLHKEIEEFGVEKRTFVDRNCGIIEKAHTVADSGGRLKDELGTTGSGTGPANADRAMRTLRLAKEVDSLKPYLADVAERINVALDNEEGVLVEGTQGTFLSLWHGTYPFVTSKDVTASGICADIGLGPKKVDDVMVVFKSYVTRVGTGVLENELPADEVARRGWSEVGTVTGRQRRAAEFSLDLAKRAVMLNSATQIGLTKLDVLFSECAHKNSFDSLSERAKEFITKIEDAVDVPVTLIGTGPGVNDIIDLRQ
ncbi:MAG: adenylosuccinate synthetase [Candidatus Nitrosotenuis sp.]